MRVSQQDRSNSVTAPGLKEKNEGRNTEKIEIKLVRDYCIKVIGRLFFFRQNRTKYQIL